MGTGSERWAGVDVGGPRKGFDIAVVDGHGVVAITRIASPREVASWLAGFEPLLVAVDSPQRAAPDGERSRACERELVRRVRCGIRYTPDQQTLRSHPGGYYDWILNGLELYRALAGFDVVECFPTATWTRLAGLRDRRPRAQWSAAALAALALNGVPERLGQDARDAIGAAVTARLAHDGRCKLVGGEIAVPGL